MANPDLMVIFNFTAQDIEANRRGTLSENQRHRLYGMLNQWALGFIIAACMIAAVAIAIYVSSLLRPGFAASSIVVFAIGIIIALGIAVVKWQHIKQDLDTGIVKVASGTAQLKTQTQRRKRPCLVIASVDLEIPTLAAYNAIAFGKQYTVYYIPQSRMILSIENTDY